MNGIRLRLMLLLAFAGLFGPACWAPALAENAPVPVFVSILPQKYFVERIGGKQVSVSVMVGPGQSPATYEPSPDQLSRLSRARLYFRIGVPFENAWMGRIKAANPKMKIVATQAGITLRHMEAPDPHAGAHTGDGVADPHVWTNPLMVKVMARHIRDALIASDPAQREKYMENYTAFAGDLDHLDAWIRAQFRDLKSRSFMVYHPSWGYFADAYGLQQIPIELEGKIPGPRTLAAAIERGKEAHVKVIFVQEQFSRRTAQTVAQSIGARVVAVDPLAENYMENLRSVTRAFAGTMKQ